MPKVIKMPALKIVPPDELLQLNQAHADSTLAKEKFQHVVTKGHLTRALLDATRLQLEVNALKHENAARQEAEKQVLFEKEALTHRQAKDTILQDLAKELRSRYDVGEKFGIDPMTGEFINVEA